MADEWIHCQAQEGTAWITLNRPEQRNALNRPMREELAAALEGAGRDSQVRNGESSKTP